MILALFPSSPFHVAFVVRRVCEPVFIRIAVYGRVKCSLKTDYDLVAAVDYLLSAAHENSADMGARLAFQIRRIRRSGVTFFRARCSTMSAC